MRTRTRVRALAAVLGTVVLLAGCAASPTDSTAPAVQAAAATEPGAPQDEPLEQVTVRLASLKGPTTMGLVGLIRDALDEPAPDAPRYEATMYGTADEIVPQLIQGEVDAALIPANLAAVVHARTQEAGSPGIAVAAITTLGVLEVVEAGDTVQSVADLAGRTVVSTGKGTTPEHVLNHVLRSNGLEPGKDVQVEYRSEATEVAALLATTPGTVAVLPQPFVTVVTTQNPGVRTALRLTEEWAAVSPDSELVTGVLVVRRAFAAEHPETVSTILADVEASARFTTEHPAEAAVLIAEAGIVPAPALAEQAIPACNITFIAGEEMHALLSGYLAVLHEADPASVGGSLPGDDFYLRP